ncbi:MAG: DUF3618 domain-containing protein [Nocardioides sp.]
MSESTIAAKEAEVERNREQLAGTVDALQAKLDVKSRAQAKLQEVKGRPVLLAGSSAAIVGLVALLWWRRR